MKWGDSRQRLAAKGFVFTEAFLETGGNDEAKHRRLGKHGRPHGAADTGTGGTPESSGEVHAGSREAIGSAETGAGSVQHREAHRDRLQPLGREDGLAFPGGLLLLGPGEEE